jgi:hypothetical protein
LHNIPGKEAFMVVAVQQPQPREDPLDAIMKGLSVAESIYGLITNKGKVQAEQKLAQEKAKRDAETNRIENEYKMASTEKTKAETSLLGKPKAEDLAKKNEQDYKKSDDLKQSYNNNSVTKNTNDVRTSYEKVKIASEEPSAAGDLSLIFGYMKMLDPGSTVREGEFANAQNSAGVPDQVRNYWNRALSGERLNENQRADFISQAKNVYKAQLKSQKVIDDQFKNFAKQWKIDTKAIIPEKYDILEQENQNLAKRNAPGLPGESKAQAAEEWSVDRYLMKQK